MNYQPKKLKGRDLELLYLHIQGVSNKEIAKMLCLHENTVSQKVNSDWFRNELAKIHSRTVTNFTTGVYSPLTVARGHSLEAMEVQLELMRKARNENVRLNASESVLRHAGFVPPQKLEVTDINRLIDKMSADELEQYIENDKIPEHLLNERNGSGTIH